ncbi:MAG: hypothetical protein OES53_02545 [Xanthomonadales bacterium]|jgi:hypothetical protein|nr:hypothetical protein [Xanthomonadales bacterium]MDH3923966.1 hypothetical protein [Xanthomonadales bacterium]MDH3941582.1 hypothetical protein [Xanthomonadales bacterium]MDH4002545.1 hypothetical protein [Xanthomonadales bacterium]
MKTFFTLMIVSFFMLIAAPVHAEAIQIFNCEYEGDATEDDVNEMGAKWLAAAKQIPGGKNLKAYVRYPVAASVDDIDFKFVLTAPDFAQWGEFTDAYEASKLVEIDDELEKMATCNDAALWEGGEVK